MKEPIKDRQIKPEKTGLEDRFAVMISQSLLQLQHRWVDLMVLFNDRLPPKIMICWWVIFGILIVAWNIHLLTVSRHVIINLAPIELKTSQPDLATDSLKLMEKIYKSYKK